MADSTLKFDIIGNALSAVRAFKDTGMAADDAARQVDKANKSLDGTSESASKTERDVGRIRGAFSGLKDVMATLFSGGGGTGGGGGLLGGLAGGIGPGIQGISAMQASLVGLVGALVAVLPAITAVGAGLGVMGGGFLVLMQTDKQFKADITSTFKGIESTVGQAARVLAGPLESAFSQLGSFVKAISPQLKEMFTAVIPLIRPLTSGLEGLVSNMLPGLIGLLKSAQPAFQAFASLLGNLGSSLGKMFGDFASVIGPSSTVLKAFGEVINSVLPLLGSLGKIFASAIAPAITQFASAIAALMPALSIIGKVIGSLASAVVGDLAGALGAVAVLAKGIAPSLKILGNALSSVFTVLENSGVFAVFGDALENLAKPLAQLVNALVEGIAPALPVIISLVGRFSSVLVTLISAGLNVMISALASVVKFLAPVLPLLFGAVAAFKILSLAVAAFNVVAAANPFGLIVLGIALLVGGIIELVKHWHDVTAVFKTGWHDIESVFKSGFELIKSGVTDFVNFIRQHWQQLATIIATVLLGPITGLIAFVATHWQEFRSLTSRVVSDVTGFFRSLPGDIMSALGALPGDLLSIGRAAIDGLLHGIESGVGAVISAVEGIGHDISGAIKSVLGIFSPSTVMYQHGRDFWQGFINGGESMRGPLAAHTASMAGSISGSAAVTAAAGAGGFGAGQELVFRFEGGDSELMNVLGENLKLYVRGRGGGGKNSVQIALGQSH